MVALVIWFSGQGLIYDSKADWPECQAAMQALENVGVESSCHLIELDGAKPK